MALFELRQYSVKPGRMPAWLKLMEGTIIPFVVSHGMVVTASFRHETDDTLYFWIRRFNDEEHRVTLYEKVYEDEHWKTSLSPKVGELLDREASVVQRLHPTALSPMQ